MIDVAHTSSQSLAIPGPRGELEALIDAPESGAHSQIAVICHPHPLHGGTMTNKTRGALNRWLVEYARDEPVYQLDENLLGRMAGRRIGTTSIGNGVVTLHLDQ